MADVGNSGSTAGGLRPDLSKCKETALLLGQRKQTNFLDGKAGGYTMEYYLCIAIFLIIFFCTQVAASLIRQNQWPVGEGQSPSSVM